MAVDVTVDGDHVVLTEVAPATEVEVTLREGTVPEVLVRLSPAVVDAILSAVSSSRAAAPDRVSSFFDRRFGIKIDAPDGLDFEAPIPPKEAPSGEGG